MVDWSTARDFMVLIRRVEKLFEAFCETGTCFSLQLEAFGLTCFLLAPIVINPTMHVCSELYMNYYYIFEVGEYEGMTDRMMKQEFGHEFLLQQKKK